jgi:uncharacterized protein YjiS (DUF1127 family)
MTTVRLHQFVEDIDISSSLYSMVQRVEAATKKIGGNLSVWASRMEDRRQLAVMSDRMLADIGLSRVEVSVEVDKYFWQR